MACDSFQTSLIDEAVTESHCRSAAAQQVLKAFTEVRSRQRAGGAKLNKTSMSGGRVETIGLDQVRGSRYCGQSSSRTSTGLCAGQWELRCPSRGNGKGMWGKEGLGRVW